MRVRKPCVALARFARHEIAVASGHDRLLTRTARKAIPSYDFVTGPLNAELPQLGVFRLGLLEDRDAGVGVVPEREKNPDRHSLPWSFLPTKRALCPVAGAPERLCEDKFVPTSAELTLKATFPVTYLERASNEVTMSVR